MTAAPLSPERLAEIERLCDEWPFRIGEPRAAVDAYRAIPELLAEVSRLREELGHATAHDGDWLSKTSRAMCDTLLGDRDALREQVRRLTAALALARAYSPFSSEPCPLCDGETCAMHRQLDEQSATIERLAKDRDHWREARSVAVEASEVLVRQRDERNTRIATLEKQVERLVAIVNATETAESVAETLDHIAAARARIDELEAGPSWAELRRLRKLADAAARAHDARDQIDESAARRIAALEDGLREACDVLDDAGGCGGTIMKLRALADGVQSSKETT